MSDGKSGWLGRVPMPLLLAFVTVQLGFWLLFDPNFINAKPEQVSRIEVTDFEYAELAEPTKAALQSAKFGVPPERQPFRLASGYHATRASFDLAAVPEDGLAILPNDSADNREIYVNGNLLTGDGQMQLPKITFHGSLRIMHRVPAAMLRSGVNQIDTVVVVDVPFEGVMPPPLMGNYKAFERAFGWQRFLFSGFQPASMVIGFVISLFLLVALLRSQKRAFLFWFFALNTLWSLNALYRLWPSFALYGYPRLLYDALVIFGISVCWPMFVDAWTGKSVRWFRRAIYAVMVLGAAYCAYWYLYDQSPPAFSQVSLFLSVSSIILMAATFLRMIWHFVRHGDDRTWEAALLLSLGILLALAFIGMITGGASGSYIGRTQPLFLLLFAVAFFARNFRLFQSSAQINELLQSQLTERTADLEAAHARETQLVRKQAHDNERQRIMRDMHDGLGSNLMSMLLAARRGDAEPQKVADGLQSVVDEMRLMIDSMDTVGESLASALATFRERVQSRVENAGFAFHWNNEAGRDLPALGPRQVLQIFRIMQEAVTNALKHSGGDQIAVNIAHGTSAEKAVKITITDNGGGITGRKVAGRGLDNMQSRASVINAALTISNGENGGAEVAIELPYERNAKEEPPADAIL